MRGVRPFVLTNPRAGHRVEEVVRFIEEKGGLGAASPRTRPGFDAAHCELA